MRLVLTNRNSANSKSVEISDHATLDDLKAKYRLLCKLKIYGLANIPPVQQRWTNKLKNPIKSGSLQENGVTNGDELFVSNLGPQINWRLVFIIEYFGPILFFTLFAFVFRVFDSLKDIQKLSYYLVMFHFIKREFESCFIHIFSKSTMPLRRLPINCAHYWILCGLFMGYSIFQPRQTFLLENQPVVSYVFTAFFLFFELMNGLTHLELRSLRSDGSLDTKIPRRFGFSKISCANYFWEIAAWITFCFIASTYATIFFTIVATVQMILWAMKKHKRYLATLPNYPK